MGLNDEGIDAVLRDRHYVRRSKIDHVTQLSFTLAFKEDDLGVHDLLRGASLSCLDIKLEDLNNDGLGGRAGDHARRIRSFFFGHQADVPTYRGDDSYTSTIPMLRTLRIRDTDLRLIGKALHEIIRFEQLHTLVLDGCTNTAVLYKHLTPLNLKLQSFADLRTSSGLEDLAPRNVNARDVFIRSLREVRQISISRMARGPKDSKPLSFATLLPRAAALKSLNLDHFCYYGVHVGNMPTIYSGVSETIEAFGALCAQMRGLEQLAICAPSVPTTADASDGTNFASFLVRLVSWPD